MKTTPQVKAFPEISREVTDDMSKDEVYKFVNLIGIEMVKSMNNSRQAADKMYALAETTGVKDLISGAEFMHAGIVQGGDTVVFDLAGEMEKFFGKMAMDRLLKADV